MISCLERLPLLRRLRGAGRSGLSDAERAHSTSQLDKDTDTASSVEVLAALKRRDESREKHFPEEGVDLRSFAESLELLSEQEREIKERRKALMEKGTHAATGDDAKQMAEIQAQMKRMQEQEQWKESLEERKRRLEEERRRRSRFGPLQSVIYFWSKPVQETHITDDDILRAAHQESMAESIRPDRGLLETGIQLYQAMGSFKESVLYFGDTITDLLALISLLDSGDETLGGIQLTIVLLNLRLMGWIIAIAGFSVVTVEDKFDSNQLVGFNYICMLWLPPPISSLILGMDFARIRLRLTSVANFFSCFLSGGERSEASEEEKLTCNPTVPVADEHELDLWDIMADIAGWRRQRKERKMEKKREEALKRDTVDISYGKVDRRRTGQHASVYEFLDAAKRTRGGDMEDSTETATQRSEESQSAVDVGAGKGGQGERGGAVRAGRAEMTVRDSETAPKSEAMRVLGLSDMDWKDWRDKRRALGDESLPFWVRKLTYSDVSGMAASQAATSPAARAYRFFISTYQYWDWIETVRDEWVLDSLKEMKRAMKRRKTSTLGRLFIAFVYLLKAFAAATIFALVTGLYFLFAFLVIFSIAFVRGIVWEIPVLASAALVPFVLMWSLVVQAFSSVDNFRAWYVDDKAKLDTLDARARAKAVIDWADFMETFFESTPSLIIQIIAYSTDATRSDAVLLSIIISAIKIILIALQFRREYAKVVMIREISKRGIITCFKNPDFYRFATWNDFKNIVEDLHPNGLAALAAGAGEDEESLMHKPNLPLQVYEELLSQPGSNPNLLDREGQSPVLDHSAGSGTAISNWQLQRGSGDNLRTDERQRWHQPIPVLSRCIGKRQSYAADAAELIAALKGAFLCKSPSAGQLPEAVVGTPGDQEAANARALEAADRFILNWMGDDVLVKNGEHTYVYLMSAMRAIKRYYEMEDFVRIAGDKEGFMPRRFCGYILSLVQRAEDCLPPNSFFVWLVHASGLASELVRVPIQPPLDPFYSLDPLLGHSAMLSVRDKHGDTALHKVCKFPQPLAACAVYRLLRYGADPWARNSHGQTPLHCACALLTSETPHVVKELVTFIAERQGRKAAAKYVNLEEDNDKSDSALHKVAAVAWTFTTMRSAGIPKKCLPRRVRKAMLFYMGKVAKSDRAEFLNLKVEDLAGTRILDETEEGGKTLEIDTAAWRSAVAENKKELGWRQHHEFAEVEADPELDADLFLDKDGDQFQAAWKKAAIDKLSWAAQTEVSDGGRSNAAGTKTRKREGEEGGEEKDGEEGEEEGAGVVEGAGGEDKEEKGKKAKETVEERKAREERQNEYYELRQSMRRDGDKQEESDKQVLVEATGEEDGYVVKMGDLRAWLEKEGKDKNMEPEAMSQDDRDALVQWVKEKVEKETIMVTISEGEDVEYKFMLGWLRKQKMSERKVEKRLAKPSKLTKDQRERLVADYKNHQKQEEEKLSRTKAALRSGMAEGIKRGELGGLSFTGFYGQGVEMLDDTRFTFQKRRYAADADVEFLPGAMGYGREWHEAGLAWRPNMQKAMETALVLVEAGAEVHRRNADGKRPVDVLVQANEKLVANAKRIIRRLVKHDLYHQLEVANSRLGSDMLGKTMAQKKKERLNLRMTLESMARAGILHQTSTVKGTMAAKASTVDSTVVFWTQIPTNAPLREFLERWAASRPDALAMHRAFIEEVRTPMDIKPFELGWGDLANETVVEGRAADQQVVEDDVDEVDEWELE